MFRLSVLLLMLLSPVAVIPQTGENSAKSVVKIETSYTGKDRQGAPSKVVNTSTGWVWNNPQWVITTLHSVAGVERIEVYAPNGKSTTAQIVRVLKEADLALLKLENDLELKPLQTQKASPQSTGTYYIWGYPHNVYTMQGDEIKFSMSLTQNPTLSDLITGHKLKQDLEVQGYPLPKAKIFRISSTIQPGHSGAPILTGDGMVIGIADGGLRGGTARINWAMPSETYITNLVNSTEDKPTSVSKQIELYSNPVYVPIDASDSEVNQYIAREEERSTVNSGTGMEIHKTWTASLGDIYDTLDEDVQIDINEMLENGMEEFLSNVYFDIYEDYDTGATFAVPFGSSVTYQDELFHVTKENSYFAFAPINASSFNEASQALELFVDGVLAEYPGAKQAQNFEDIYEMDEYNEYLDGAIFREVYEDGGNYLLIVGGSAMGSDLACMLMVCPLPREMDEAQAREFIEFALATEIISFSGH